MTPSTTNTFLWLPITLGALKNVFYSKTKKKWFEQFHFVIKENRPKVWWN